MSTYAGQQQPREQEQVIGIVTGLIQKGPDSWQAAVVTDAQRTKNLWTKDQNLVQYLSGQIGQRLAFLCNASYWDRGGQQVRSLWIEQVGPPTPGSPAMAGPTQGYAGQPPSQQSWAGTPPQQPVVAQPQATPMPFDGAQSHDVKEQRIHRQTASKVAAIMLTHVAPEERTMASLLVMAERLVAYYNEGLPHAETLDQLMQRAMPSSVDSDAAQGVGYENTPPDDIPF